MVIMVINVMHADCLSIRILVRLQVC
jgi:hypothetical protein